MLAYLRELQRRHSLSVLVVHHAKKSSGRIRAGQAYVDVGTLSGYREAMWLLSVRHQEQPYSRPPTDVSRAHG